MTQIGSVGGEIWQIGGDKWGSRRGQLGMCAPTGTLQAQVCIYVWVLSLQVASWGTHTLGTFKSTPFSGLRRPPLVDTFLIRCTVLYECDVWSGLARTISLHRLWSHIWYFPCRKYRIYTVYILYLWFLANLMYDVWPRLAITMYIRYLWQRNHQIYGHIWCNCTVMANPTYDPILCDVWPIPAMTLAMGIAAQATSTPSVHFI
jgi:hypothetical protein